MKEEIMKKLSAVMSALNGVSVSGRQNLVGLSGSMAVIEEVLIALNSADVTVSKKTTAE